MKYLLDTNICIAILNGKDSALNTRLLTFAKKDLVICSVVKAELIYGVHKSRERIKNEQRLKIFLAEFKSLPFDDQAAENYGLIRAALELSGTPIGANDLMIAAICLAHKLTVITRNSREFERINSLSVEAW